MKLSILFATSCTLMLVYMACSGSSVSDILNKLAQSPQKPQKETFVFETPHNYVGSWPDFERFLVKTCGYQSDNQDFACVDNLANTYHKFGIGSPELQKRAIHWTSLKKDSSVDDLLTGHSAVASRNIITADNFVGTEKDFDNFLVNTCGAGDNDCYNEMMETYDMFAVESWQVQARAIQWNSKKAFERATRAKVLAGKDPHYTSLRYFTPIVNTLQQFTTTCIVIVLVVLFVVFYYALARFTKPGQYALPLPNHYETTKTQRRSSSYYKIKNYFYGPKSLDLPLPGAYNRKVYKYSV